MARRRPHVLITAVLLAGCTTFPELEGTISADAQQRDYLELVPVDSILARRSSGQITEMTGDILRARAANLQARADLLRGVVVDDATRLRLAAALARLSG